MAGGEKHARRVDENDERRRSRTTAKTAGRETGSYPTLFGTEKGETEASVRYGGDG
jgi:hypothetical protein